MRASLTRRGTGWGLALGLLLLAGCAFIPGGRVMSPGGNRLLNATQDVCQPPPDHIARELHKQVLPPCIVEPGDVLAIHPADLDSPVRLPGDQPVLPDGSINLGRYGHLVVAGHTVEEIECLVRAAVEVQTKEAGFIVVRLVARQSKVYYVLGEVNAPGAFPLSGRETVLDGILAAGGLNDRASRKNIVLVRPTLPDSCRIVLAVRLRDIVQLGDTTTNYQLAPGDRIFIPTRGCWEDGLFGKQKDCWSCVGSHSACPLNGAALAEPSGPAPAALPPTPDLLPAPRPAK
jgi:protein involved in polysaccharide export with SLBB domain